MWKNEYKIRLYDAVDGKDPDNTDLDLGSKIVPSTAAAHGWKIQKDPSDNSKLVLVADDWMLKDTQTFRVVNKTKHAVGLDLITYSGGYCNDKNNLIIPVGQSKDVRRYFDCGIKRIYFNRSYANKKKFFI